MASGNEARIGAKKETVWGTRVVPDRFFPFLSEAIDYQYANVQVPVLGTGPWQRVQRTTTQGGSGPIVMPVTTTGFGWWLDLLHDNAVTPVQQASTAAYLQTHTLSTMSQKSFSAQVQTPAVGSSTLLPQDFTGCMIGSVEFSWDADQELRVSFTVVPQKLDTSQTLATYAAPTSWSFFTFMDGSITIGGTPVPSVGGSGTLTLNIPRRDDFYALGSNGLIAKPEVNDKPTAEVSFTADFLDLTHWNRTANNTIADLVIKFQHPTAIASTYYPYIEFTVPDCMFQSPRPQVEGPGLLQQGITVTGASASGNPPVIKLQSADTLL